MTTATVGIMLAVFAACLVEMTEALTIVLAVGTTRGWKPALQGAATALGVLTVFVLAGGLPLIHYVPLRVLQIAVGTLLLYVGATWWRKSVLRASGRKAHHDEDAIYADTVQSLRRNHVAGFAVSFKGVMVEGFEVLLIVVGLGSASHKLGFAGMAAGAAVLLVTIVGAILVRQLSKIPENALKMGVATLLLSFGCFWTGEGVGLHWPGSDASLLGLIALVGSLTALVVSKMRLPVSESVNG